METYKLTLASGPMGDPSDRIQRELENQLGNARIELDVLFTNISEIPKDYWIRTDDPDVLADLEKKYGLEKGMDPRGDGDRNWVIRGNQGYFSTPENL